jgi:hypothetical protein
MERQPRARVDRPVSDAARMSTREGRAADGFAGPHADRGPGG